MIKQFEENKELRFCKIETGTKKPYEKDWVNKPYTYEAIKSHIENKTNYGVICGYGGLVVIDSDTKELRDAIERNLPETFRVKTY